MLRATLLANNINIIIKWIINYTFDFITLYVFIFSKNIKTYHNLFYKKNVKLMCLYHHQSLCQIQSALVCPLRPQFTSPKMQFLMRIYIDWHFGAIMPQVYWLGANGVVDERVWFCFAQSVNRSHICHINFEPTNRRIRINYTVLTNPTGILKRICIWFDDDFQAHRCMCDIYIFIDRRGFGVEMKCGGVVFHRCVEGMFCTWQLFKFYCWDEVKIYVCCF